MKRKNILVACEFSGIVRDEFIKRGHNAVSCDLLPSERKGPHLQMDFRRAFLKRSWDTLIAFPECTYITVAGNRWFTEKPFTFGPPIDRFEKRIDALLDVIDLWRSGIGEICIENPIGVLSTLLGQPTQILQPHEHGHGEVKATCLWLKNLAPLKPTRNVAGRVARVHRASPGPDRWKERARFLPGIARAMALRWG